MFKKYFFFSALLFFGFNCYPQVIIHMNYENGVYTIPCEVNGLNLKFIFDTGASNVSISLTEASYMLKHGHLEEDDIYGTSYAKIANGDITENTEILLKEIEIGGIKIYDIKASVVHELEAPLLLGQSAIQKLGKIQLDGNKLIIFNNSPVSSSRSSSYKTSRSSHRNTSAYSSNKYSNYGEVYACSAIYDKPNNGKKIEQACNGRVNILSKYNEKFYKVQYQTVVGFMNFGAFKNPPKKIPSSEKNKKTNNASSVSNKNYTGTKEVYTCAAIYKKPDSSGKKIGQACNGYVTIIERKNEKYYKVRYQSIVGYLMAGSFK
jgi:clan AA aspartic protease (TIGR02281 family)